MRCIELKEVVLSDGITEIGVSAFERCEKLCTITIPSSVSKIGRRAFLMCTSLTDIYIMCATCEIDADVKYDSGEVYYTLGVPGITRIHGYTMSSAQAYAAQGGFVFVVLDALRLTEYSCRPKVAYCA